MPLDSEAAATHTVALAINAAVETFKNAQRDADAALRDADNVVGRDRDLAVNAVNRADTDAAIEREKTRTITHWNTFNAYAPQQGQAEADWAAAIKAASTDLKQALLLAEDVFIRALVSGQLERSLVALYTAHEGQRASQSATYAEDLAAVQAVRVADLARELSSFGTVNLQMPPAVTFAMEAERRSTRPSGFYAFLEGSLNTLTGGLSRRILLSPGFTRILNAVDGLFAGWAHALTMGLSTRVRTAMWGETATRNHQGEWFNLGNTIGSVHTMIMMTGNPCAMGSLGGGALRALNGIQMVGGGINMAENLASGNYLAAAFDGIGMLANFSALSRVCFTGEVEAITKRGWVRFDALREDDEVLAGAENDPFAEPQYKRVEEIFIGFARIWHLHVKGEVIRTTDEHPFYVWGKGWVPTKHLEIGDVLRSHDGRMIEVEDVCDAGYEEVVYNCRVAEYHTYFVGRSDWGFGVWAHNRCNLRLAEKQITSTIDKLKAAIPGFVKGRITIAVAKTRTASGRIRWLVSINGPAGKISNKYMSIIRENLPASARIRIAFRHHPRATYGKLGNHLDDAERHITRTIRREGLELLGIGATNNVCARCQIALRASLSRVFTPLA